MIISSTYLKNALEKYKEYKKKKSISSTTKEGLKGTVKEGYTTADGIAAGSDAAFASFGVVVAIIFFILELILLFYAILMAINCSKPGSERIVNVVLSITFTLPYILLKSMFEPCSKNTLLGNNFV